MPAATRLTDICTGHSCFPPRPNIGGSGDVFTNSLQQVRLGDPYQVHVCGNSAHPGKLSKGSGSVYVNSKEAGRIGDSIDCGSNVAVGSGNVFIGG